MPTPLGYMWKRPLIGPSHPDVCPFLYTQLYGNEVPNSVANQIIAEYNASPRTQRIWLCNGYGVGNRPDAPAYNNHPILTWHNDDRLASAETANARFGHPWFENGIVTARDWALDVLNALSAQQFYLDVILMDMEESRVLIYNGNQWLTHFNTVKADARWDTLEVYDGKTLKTLWEDAGSPAPVNGQYFSQSGNQPFSRWWTTVLVNATNRAMYRALYSPAKTIFPAVKCGNYKDLTANGIKDDWAAGASWLYTDQKSWADIQTMTAYPVHYTHAGATDKERMINQAHDIATKIPNNVELWVWYPAVGISFPTGNGNYAPTAADIEEMHDLLKSSNHKPNHKPIIWFNPTLHDSATYLSPTYCVLDMPDYTPAQWPNQKPCYEAGDTDLVWIWHKVATPNTNPSTYGIDPNHPILSGWNNFLGQIISDHEKFQPDAILIDAPFGYVSNTLHRIDNRLEWLKAAAPFSRLARPDEIERFISNVYAATGKYPWFRLGGFEFGTPAEVSRWQSMGAYKAITRVEQALRPFLQTPVGVIIDGDGQWTSPEWNLAVILRTWSQKVGYWGYPRTNRPWGTQYTAHIDKKAMGFFVSHDTWFSSGDTVVADAKSITSIHDKAVILLDAVAGVSTGAAIDQRMQQLLQLKNYSCAVPDSIARTITAGT